jgi:hypothetical protein
MYVPFSPIIQFFSRTAKCPVSYPWGYAYPRLGITAVEGYRYHSNQQAPEMGNESNSMSRCLRESCVTVNTATILIVLISVWFPTQRSRRQYSTSSHGVHPEHLKNFRSRLHHKPKKKSVITRRFNTTRYLTFNSLATDFFFNISTPCM